VFIAGAVFLSAGAFSAEVVAGGLLLLGVPVLEFS